MKKLNETGDMTDTDPELFTGSKVDPKTGEILCPHGEKVDPNGQCAHDDEAQHETPDKLAAREIVATPMLNVQKQVREWITVSENEFGEYVGMNFGVTKEEAPEIKDNLRGLAISDSYLTMLNKDSTMSNNKTILSETLANVGIKTKRTYAVFERRQDKVSDFMNLGVSKPLNEDSDKTFSSSTKTTPEQEVHDKKSGGVLPAKPQLPEHKEESPLKAFNRTHLSKKNIW